MSENSQQSSADLAASLVSPNTEKAVQELINTSAPAATPAQPSNEDNFENLQRAVSILARAKTLDEIKKYDEALSLYRQGVDMLLEELIIRQGTEQSRSYLRDKCNDFMNRIDQLKLIIQIEKADSENKENQVKAQ